MACMDIGKLVLAANLHRHLVAQIRIHHCGQGVVHWRENSTFRGVQQREILGVRIVVADECVENHEVE